MAGEVARDAERVAAAEALLVRAGLGAAGRAESVDEAARRAAGWGRRAGAIIGLPHP